MRFTAVTLLAAVSSLAAAQLLDQLPECAQKCYTSNQGTCNAIDIGCICGNSTLIEGLSCCVSQTCQAAEQDTIIKFASGLCAAYDVEVPTSATCAGSSATPAPTQSASESASEAASQTTSEPSETESAAAEDSPTPSSTGGAAVHTGVGIGLGLGMVGLLAAL
ncbi:hypothetical protein M011DRAFT_524329 [Sporormia fimetaria CBS 119925]|uniref:CFEM domain-containing protein n=1 Tax=Sporormia fimetaria CBS 119925 TaxID=1340428 RepID=A0A6A6VGA6_9PLEO|nr:hypothetical protein M011DRAFT_524329 [Sporormia fimetaria CBS 119925]